MKTVETSKGMRLGKIAGPLPDILGHFDHQKSLLIQIQAGFDPLVIVCRQGPFAGLTSQSATGFGVRDD